MPKINCDGCGVCCTSVGCPPFIDEEVNNLPAVLKSQVIQLGYDSSHADKKACYWYDSTTKKCLHHEHRPQICKDFDAGGPICMIQRQFYNIK